jgi:flagellar hook-basal body complex protein FliE
MVNAVSSVTSMIDRAGAIAAPQSMGIQGTGLIGAGAVPQTSFGDMMAQVAGDAIGTLKAGEAAAISGIQGKSSVQQVVEAVMSAEQTLQTAIAIRDKVIAAYQEISRMAI